MKLIFAVLDVSLTMGLTRCYKTEGFLHLLIINVGYCRLLVATQLILRSCCYTRSLGLNSDFKMKVLGLVLDYITAIIIMDSFSEKMIHPKIKVIRFW